MLFELGQTVMTRAVADTLEEYPDFMNEIQKAMQRYTNGDWGELCEEDAHMNDRAVVEKNARIFAAYNVSYGEKRIWIITEWDRSVTTILYPGDY